MKKFLAILLAIIFFWPSINYAKQITCTNSRDFEAIIEIDKDIINLNEEALISVKGKNDVNILEVKYDTRNKDLINISDLGIVKGIKEGNAQIETTVYFEDESSCSVYIPLEIVSNDASLKTLTLEELDLSTIFKEDVYEYELNLPYRYEKVNIIAEANNAKAEVKGTGRKYLSDGLNEFEIVVVVPDGTSKTYKLKITRQEASNDNTLKNLIIEGYILTPKFKSDVYNYSLNVSKEVESITINAEPNFGGATVKGVGTFTLATGKSYYHVTVIAENGDELRYTIEVNRNNGSSKLNGIEIEGFALDKSFQSDIYTYNLTVGSDVTSLKINPLTDENDQVEILGNENLKEGENEIILRVIGEDKTTTTYKLIVNKLSQTEENDIAKNSIFRTVLLIIFIIAIIVMFTFFYK